MEREVDAAHERATVGHETGSRIVTPGPLAPAPQHLGLMPVHFQYTIWATKKGVTYTPRTDEYTLAFQFRPAKG